MFRVGDISFQEVENECCWANQDRSDRNSYLTHEDDFGTRTVFIQLAHPHILYVLKRGPAVDGEAQQEYFGLKFIETRMSRGRTHKEKKLNPFAVQLIVEKLNKKIQEFVI